MNEPRISGLRRALRRPGASVEREVDDEIAFHIDSRVRELVARGQTPDAARALAEAEYGDLTASRRELAAVDRKRRRRERADRWIETTAQDIRYAARTLRRSPGFTATVIACVGIGIGLTTTIVGAVNAVLVRPLPYANANELVSVYSQNASYNAHGVNVSFPDYASWRDRSRTFSKMGIWSWRSYALSSGVGDAERADGADVAVDLFPLLGVKPFIGRTFLRGEEQPGNDRVLLLGYDLWQRRYGGDRTLVGKTVMVDARPYTVVGVMPPGFSFPERGSVWTPFAIDLANQPRGNRIYAGAIGRLARGQTIERARADLARISAALVREFRNENEGWEADAIPLRQDLVGDLRRPLLVFLGGVGLVLIIVCANVANLLLVRGMTRARELSVRVAIGAERGRIVRQLLTETMMLTMIGGALGAALAVVGIRALALAFPNGTPFYIRLQLDWRTLAVALALSVLTGVLFGLIPAFIPGRDDLTASLKEGGRGGSASVRSGRMRSALVMAEITLSVILMIGAGLLMRSYQRLAGKDLGFNEQGAMIFKISLPRQKYSQQQQRAAFYDALHAKIAAIPGVTSEGSGQGAPFSGWDMQTGIVVEGQPIPRESERLVSHYQWVTPGFLDALAVRWVSGRKFTTADRDSINVPGIVNQSFAKKFFGGASPLGRHVRGGPNEPWVTIVGMVEDYQHYRLPKPMGPAIYYPYATNPLYSQTFVVRTTLANPTALAPSIRAAVRSLDADVPAYGMRTLEEQVGSALWRQRLQGQVLGVFAAVALALAVIGIYGVISYGVTQRWRELGVRIALGASPSQVLGLVLKQGMLLTVASIGIGVLGAALLARTLAGLLYGVDALDALTFTTVPLVFGGAALVATFIPARRAAGINPLTAIRSE